MKKLFYCLISLCIVGCSNSPSDPDAGMKNKAGIISKDFVENRLRNKETADFPTLDRVVEKLNHNEYKVLSFVKAKNDFGVEKKYFYRAILVYKGGDWSDTTSWSLRSLEFEVE